MTPFFKKSIQTLLSKHDDLQQMVIILPSKRAGVILTHYLIEVLETPQFAPEIFSIEAFIEHLSSLKKPIKPNNYSAFSRPIKKNIQKKFKMISPTLCNGGHAY